MLSLNGWLWIVFGILLVATIGFFALSAFLSEKNLDMLKNGFIYQFSGIIGNGNTLTRKDGTNQITCPVGKNIRILGSYFDVYDPYLECVADVKDGASKQFQKTCQSIYDNNKGTAWFNCGLFNPLYGCNCSGSPVPSCDIATGAPGAACECAHTDPANGWRNCACSNYEGNRHNFNCKSRDNSAYVAEACDGKNTCALPVDTSAGDASITSVLGPYPCSLSPSDSNYSLLPMVRGNQGINNTDNSTMSQGYYVHGLFTCE